MYNISIDSRRSFRYNLEKWRQKPPGGQKAGQADSNSGIIDGLKFIGIYKYQEGMSVPKGGIYRFLVFFCVVWEDAGKELG